MKHRFDWLESFSDDELQKISFCRPGDGMEMGEEYFDISHPESGIIMGEEGSQIPEGSCYVPKSEIALPLWDKLVASYS